MFTTFSLLKSTKASENEHQEFYKLLGYYSNTPEGKWLNEIPFRSYEIHWCHAMQKTSGVMGAYVPWLGNKVFLLPSSNPPVNGFRDTWLTLIASTLVHELRHAWQYRRNKLSYVFCCLPIVREFALEKDAHRIQKLADEYFKVLDNHRSAAEFAARNNQQEQ